MKTTHKGSRMQSAHTVSYTQPIFIAVVAFVVTAALFVWDSQYGFDLLDEGYIWYGVQRVLAGEVPILDFKAYDPTRYYWSAAFMKIIGSNGLIALRISIAILQFISLLLCLWLLLKNNVSQKSILLIAAVILSFWMDRISQYDIFASIFIFCSLFFLLENRSKKRYFLFGICVGFISTVGRNHGIYALIATAGVFTYLRIMNYNTNFFKSIPYWITGIFVGYLPIIFMMIFIPGFGKAFIDGVLFLFEVKTTNLSLPIPWPWLVSFSDTDIVVAIILLTISIFFMVMLAACIGGAILLIFKIKSAQQIPLIFVVSFFVLIPYAHYAFSRADIAHLSRGIFPLLLAIIIYLSQKQNIMKWSVIALLLILTTLPTFLIRSSTQCRLSWCVSITFSGGDTIHMDSETAQQLEFIQLLINTFSAQQKQFVMLPYGAGMYAAFFNKSPLWDNFALFARDEAFQYEEIERIKKASPAFVVIIDIPLDGIDGRRFTNTHPLIYKYITDNFAKVDLFPNQPDSTLIYAPADTLEKIKSGSK